MAKRKWKDIRQTRRQPDEERSCTSKVRYPNSGAARKAASSAQQRNGVSLNTYACEHCGGWHLTSR